MIVLRKDFDRQALAAIDPFDRIAAARAGPQIDDIGAQADEARQRLGFLRRTRRPEQQRRRCQSDDQPPQGFAPQVGQSGSRGNLIF
jgi:hypothetical protein